MADHRPIAPSERVAVLDVLRGFALFGVLIANTGWFTTQYLSQTPPATDVPAIDFIAREWMRFFVHGKAMTTLSFLFGFGFSVTLLRADARGESGVPLFARRLAVLIAIGWCHVAFLWWGDVLWIYGMCGFALLAFRRADERALLKWALALIAVQFLFGIPPIASAVQSLIPASGRPQVLGPQLVNAINTGGWSDIVPFHIRHAVFFTLSALWWVFAVLGRFLLGFYAGKRGLFDRDGADHLALFRRLIGWGLALNVVAYGVGSVMNYWVRSRYDLLWPARMATQIVNEAGTLGMAAASISIIVLLMQRPRVRRWLTIVAPVGRMPLTIYLMQSVFGTVIYYGWGLGIAKSAGTAGSLAISFGLFALQIAIAHLWLRHFRFGPADWVWRSIVYRGWQPMRISAAVPEARLLQQ